MVDKMVAVLFDAVTLQPPLFVDASLSQSASTVAVDLLSCLGSPTVQHIHGCGTIVGASSAVATTTGVVIVIVDAGAADLAIQVLHVCGQQISNSTNASKKDRRLKNFELHLLLRESSSHLRMEISAANLLSIEYRRTSRQANSSHLLNSSSQTG